MKRNSTGSCIKNKKHQKSDKRVKMHLLTPRSPMVTDNSMEVKDSHLGGTICQSLQI